MDVLDSIFSNSTSFFKKSCSIVLIAHTLALMPTLHVVQAWIREGQHML